MIQYAVYILFGFLSKREKKSLYHILSLLESFWLNEYLLNK